MKVNDFTLFKVQEAHTLTDEALVEKGEMRAKEVKELMKRNDALGIATIVQSVDNDPEIMHDFLEHYIR
jgi:transcription initiation factor IIE alpha subunit